jgi:hypothetical protein
MYLLKESLEKERRYPNFCIDDFFENPDDVREFALSLEYFPSCGARPGKSSKSLHLVDKVFYDKFCEKIFSIFYDFNRGRTDWKLGTFFQLTDSLDENKNSGLNKSWIHADLITEFAGVIYLNKNPSDNTGTSLYNVKNLDKFLEIWDNYEQLQQNPRHKFYKDGVVVENYDEEVTMNNSFFEETVSFKNVYNRLVAYDGGVWHGAQGYYAEKEPRLTQVFFVYDIESEFKYPLCRMPKIKYDK